MEHCIDDNIHLHWYYTRKSEEQPSPLLLFPSSHGSVNLLPSPQLFSKTSTFSLFFFTPSIHLLQLKTLCLIEACWLRLYQLFVEKLCYCNIYLFDILSCFWANLLEKSSLDFFTIALTLFFRNFPNIFKIQFRSN